jgi:hypothetical protein
MVLEFIEALGTTGTGLARRRALREAWLMHHRYRTARLLLARGRAGATDQCTDALSLLVNSFPGGRMLPRRMVNRTGHILSVGLSKLQAFLPGGRAKYANLGVSVPR